MFSNCSSSAAKKIQIHNDEKWNEGAPGKFSGGEEVHPTCLNNRSHTSTWSLAQNMLGY